MVHKTVPALGKLTLMTFIILFQALGFLYASGLGVNSSQAKVRQLKLHCILHCGPVTL